MTILVEKEIRCLGYLYEKGNVALFVKDEKDIEKLHLLLCQYNPDWLNCKHLIHVSPQKVTELDELDRLCRYAGKCALDIYDIEEIKKEVDFIIYQSGASDYE